MFSLIKALVFLSSGLIVPSTSWLSSLSYSFNVFLLSSSVLEYQVGVRGKYQ